MGTISARKRAKDLLLEVVIAIALVTAFVAYLFSLPKGTRIDGRPVALLLNTVTVFAFLISWFRRAWKRLAFWATLALLLLAHTAAYIFVLSRIRDWPLAYYLVLNPVELAVVAPILTKILSLRTDEM